MCKIKSIIYDALLLGIFILHDTSLNDLRALYRCKKMKKILHMTYIFLIIY